MASEYFATVQVEDVDIVKFLNAACAPGLVDVNAYQKAIDSYIKSLNSLVDDENLPKSARDHAASLMDRYRTGPDKELARRWLQARKPPPSHSTNVTINGDMLGGSVNAIGVLAPTVAASKKRQTRLEEEGNEEGEGGGKEKKKRKKKGGDQAGIASLDNNNTYRRMTADSMWKLPSGAYVEDVLRNAPGLARSFVIDVLDPSVEKLFDPDDWPEILAQVPPWPDIDEKLVSSMERFWDAESPAQLRKILGSTSFLKEDEQYNRAENYDLDWIDLCFRMLLPLYEDPDQILLKDHNEQWYTINIWSVIVDRCLQNLSGITLRRGETTSIESTARRNRDRVATTRRKRLGARFDGLAQDNNGQLEYLAMETSRTFDGETSSKWLCDTRKVAKSLHGMLYRLQGHVKQDGVILREMHMAGLVSAGLHCQVLRMTYAKGHYMAYEDDCPEVQGLRRETWAGNQAFGLAVTPEPPEPSQLIDLMSHYSSLL
ncbi:uncharacterized protein H6S33_001892 [Morchella sextelata]|uniref:uncharacterized protein n=1 Tax=Morchella sextelata TaxID=1174677 RepID=UPI001D04AC4E|nr:uncharacterized protein H6S33_001892 [Morchella sextelata]KAH0608758.1 hypothetical protein H6S33_001892 [Morchella sextelata]